MNNNRNVDKRRRNSGGNRGKGRNNKGYDKKAKFDGKLDTEDMKSAANDPAWYGHSVQLLSDAASFPFSYTMGLPVPGLRHYDTTAERIVEQKEVFPGVLSFTMIPTFGWGNADVSLTTVEPDPTSPYSVAANRLFTEVRKSISGSRPYEAPDLMIYVRAMCECYSFLVWARRIYGCMAMWSPLNRYIPKALVEIQGVDPDSIMEHLADYRYAINLLTNKIASLVVPDTMDVFKKAAFIYQDVYTEGSVEKDQLYLYQPDGFCRFALDDDSKGMLEYVPLQSYNEAHDGRLKWDEIIAYGTDLFEAIWQEEEFTTMSGDLSRTFSDHSLTLYTMGDDYTVPFKHDEAVLTQMQNTTILPTAASTFTGLRQYSASNYTPWLAGTTALFFDAEMDHYSQLMEAARYSLECSKIITINAEHPDPHMVIEATRNLAGWWKDEQYLNQGWYYHITTADYACVGASIAIIDPHSMDTSVHQYRGNFVFDLSAQVSGDVWHKYTVLPKFFKYMPEIDLYGYTDEGMVYAERNLSVDNWTVLSDYNVQKLHETAILSLLGVIA